MFRILIAVLVALLAPALSVSGVAVAGEKAAGAYEPMAVFSKLTGKAWRGEGTGPNGQPIVDISRYEMILNGRAFQSTHRLEDGTYGGRTIFFFDEGAKEYVFHYFTVAGFHTTGTIVPRKDGFTAIETVNGHPEFAEVHSDMIVGEGELRVVTRHVDHDGEESAGDTLVYKEIDDPGPLF